MNDSSSAPSNFSWERTFRDVLDRCIERYRDGDRDWNAYFTDGDLAFLRSIGYKPRELFDFVEDWCEDGEPSPDAAVLIAAARRDFLYTMQDGKLSEHEIRESDLPPRDAELGGLSWLPRIIVKARAKLRGELDPDIMFSCGGDRAFLRKVDIHPADFLRAVWAAGDSEEKVLEFVRERGKKA